MVVPFAREPREVEDSNEVDFALVRPAVLEEPLELENTFRSNPGDPTRA